MTKHITLTLAVVAMASYFSYSLGDAKVYKTLYQQTAMQAQKANTDSRNAIFASIDQMEPR